MLPHRTALALVCLAACGGDGDAPPTGDLPDAGVADDCPDGQFATDLAGGSLTCAPIAPTATAAMAGDCSLFFGWRDTCDGCQSLPAKWGRISGLDCENGVGADDTCADTDLGGATLPLFGLNTDGDVNDDDKLFVAMQCAVAEDEPVAGPCAEGSFLSGVTAEGPECVTARGVITEYLRDSCRVYLGARDSCNGCSDPPTKWGRAGSTGCELGEGGADTCTSFRLGDTTAFTFGLNTDGDVNDDDKLYIGLQCDEPPAAGESRAARCPAGELVVGIDNAGELSCASPLPAARAAIAEGCSLYLGWRDGCDGCTTAPAKWGRTGLTSCENGAGADNTCLEAELDGTAVQLFGLNPDGDVDDNDKLYVGLACPASPVN